MNKIQVLSSSDSRKESVVNNTPSIFLVDSNPEAIATKPVIELGFESEVSKWCGLILHVSNKYGLDPTLVMAIMYMETTHGWYDKFYPLRKTILPMNIHYKYWRDLGVTKELLNCPYYNIEFGAILLSRISQRIKNPTIAKVATVYNFIGAEKVTDYGARVARLYFTRPWKKNGCSK